MFVLTLPLADIFIRDQKTYFFEEIYDADICKAVESFEDQINVPNEEEKEEEVKTVEKSHFVELLDQIRKPIKQCITL